MIIYKIIKKKIYFLRNLEYFFKKSNFCLRKNVITVITNIINSIAVTAVISKLSIFKRIRMLSNYKGSRQDKNR